MRELSSVSAVFPCYNDGGTIASVVLRARAALEELTDDYEIVVVNDGSADYAPFILEQLIPLVPALRVITHDHNRGYGGALRSGFGAAVKDYIFYTDGDAQYDPQEVLRLSDLMTDDVDVVNGYKVRRNDPLSRKVVGGLYRFAIGRLFGLVVRDVDCDFRLMRRALMDKVVLRVNSGAFCVELMKKLQNAGARIVELPVQHYLRPYGRSQFFRPRRVARTLIDLFRLWWRLIIAGEGRIAEQPVTPGSAPAERRGD